MKVFYFAYGSNMSVERLKERDVTYTDIFTGYLDNYELVFNKISKYWNGRGVGNIIPKEGLIVEGVVYEVEFSELETKLDKFEGYPKHYDRQILQIKKKDNTYIDSYVYIAKEEMTREGLEIPKDYLAYFLGGKDYLSESYYNNLLSLYNSLGD